MLAGMGSWFHSVCVQSMVMEGMTGGALGRR